MVYVLPLTDICKVAVDTVGLSFRLLDQLRPKLSLLHFIMEYVCGGGGGGGGAKMKEHVALGINVSAFEVTLHFVRCGLMSELSKKGYRNHSFEQTIT